ncbi:cytochrome c oxidase assembly protein [Rarobacter faecitabidus]|uniref:cytochrome c oxidase assembly protein n=1 Tax=Rarobacter faecitabidus TaxID=13243 RepID=UPI001FE53CF0|nr:cytochrome c oxidase assembly protein [Rarobacter faecitabidus]
MNNGAKGVRGRAPAQRSRSILSALAATLLLSVVVTLLAGWWSGALDPSSLLDAGPVARFGLPIVTVLAELAFATTIGGLVLAAALVPSQAARRTALVTGAIGAGLWAAFATARVILTASVTMGVPLSDASFGSTIEVFTTQLEGGRTMALIPILAAAVACVALASSTATGAGWALAATGVAAAMQSTLGHSSSEGGHHAALTAMFLHLLGAAVWIGPLIALAVLWLRRVASGDEFTATLRRYSTLAAWAYVLVAVSGIASAVIRLNSFADLRSHYGAILLAKVAVIALLGAIGAAHRRYVLAPGRLDSGRAAPGVRFWRLAGVELLLMGVVSGLAVALSRTAPPAATAVPDVTAVYLVTGQSAPPPASALTYLTQWSPDVLFGFAAVAGAVVYLRWALRLRARGDRWSAGRTAAWILAMILFAWVTSGGPAVYGHLFFSAHMLQHMIMAMVIPLLLSAAAPVTLALRAVPGRRDDSRGPREWLLTLLHSRWAGFFSNPIVAAVNFAGSMIVFYYTPAFEYALRTSLGHALMVVHFSLAGYLFANALVGIDPGTKRPSYPLRLVLLLATMAFHAFFGVALMSSEQLLVANWFGWLGLTNALADQQSGGEIAWGIGEVPTFLLAVIVAIRWSSSDERDAKRRDRRVDRAGDAELTDYNEMLARLSESDE